MNVKELKSFLAGLPEEADGWDVLFSADDLEGCFVVEKARATAWDEGSVPPGCTKDVALLWNGEWK